MPIQPGALLPDMSLKSTMNGAVCDIAIRDFCATGKTVIFAVPGAYTPACSARHLPGFIEHAAALRAKHVDRIACIAVNDAFVMDVFARANHVSDSIIMLADGNAEFTRAVGLDSDARPYGMGIRSQRYAMVIQDGRVVKVFVDEPGAFEASAAHYVLSQL